jgi:hypothetical protein
VRADFTKKKTHNLMQMQQQQQLGFPPTAGSFKRHANSLEFINPHKKERKQARKKEIRRSKKIFTKLQALHTKKKKKKKKLECGCVLQGLAVVVKKAMY